MKAPYLFLVLLLGYHSVHALTRCTSDTCSQPLKAGTFNTNQIPIFTVFDDERLDATVDFLNEKTDFDVLCLQELWEPDDLNAIVEGVKDQYPFAFFAPQFDQDCRGGCSDDDISTLSNCAEGCTSAADDSKCIREQCKDQFEDLPNRCQKCIGNLDNDDFSGRLTACTGVDLDLNSTNCRFIFDGFSDNLILSKFNFTATEVRLLEPSPINAVTALYVAFPFPSVGTVHAFCTHPIADLPFIKEQTENINGQELSSLVEFVNNVTANAADPNNVVLIMGDLNAGPNFFEENYAIVIDDGYTSAFVLENPNADCTLCANNDLNELLTLSTGDDRLIDHILVRNTDPLCVTQSELFATSNEVTIVGDNADLPLSDHYGVSATFCELSDVGVTSVVTTRGPAAEGSASTVAVQSILIFGASIAVFMFMF